MLAPNASRATVIRLYLTRMRIPLVPNILCPFRHKLPKFYSIGLGEYIKNIFGTLLLSSLQTRFYLTFLCIRFTLLSDVIFCKFRYVKKVIEDTNMTEEAIKLIQFCSWENPHFSRTVLSELLWQIAFAYCQELRHHIDILLSVLLIEDTWQTHRIHNAIKGVPDEREGLLETISRAKLHYQKRAYQCIKCMVALFNKCRVAQVIRSLNYPRKRYLLCF